MSYLNDDVLDMGLDVLTDAVDKRLDICTAEPATFLEARTTYSLGNKTAFTVGATTDGTTGGRKVTTGEVNGGAITGTGTVAYWAITDATRLLAAGALADSQNVNTGNVFTLAAFDITIPDVL
jgi:hypothetical protein